MRNQMSERASPLQDVIKLLQFVFLLLLSRFQVPPQEPLVLGLLTGSFFDGAGKGSCVGVGRGGIYPSWLTAVKWRKH